VAEVKEKEEGYNMHKIDLIESMLAKSSSFWVQLFLTWRS
jgi:hypothetical protein